MMIPTTAQSVSVLSPRPGAYAHPVDMPTVVDVGMSLLPVIVIVVVDSINVIITIGGVSQVVPFARLLVKSLLRYLLI